MGFCAGVHGFPGHLRAAEGDDHDDDREEGVVRVVAVGGLEWQGQDGAPRAAGGSAPGGYQAQERGDDVVGAPVGFLGFVVELREDGAQRDGADDAGREVAGGHEPGMGADAADSCCHLLFLLV